MSRSPSLTKQQLNERFYSAVDPEAAFVTEVQVGFHPVAVARLLAAQARRLGRTRLRVLELGASTGLFAIGFLQVMGQLVLLGEAGLGAVDYTAVEYSAAALGTALRTAERDGYAAGTDGLLQRREGIEARLGLVHAEANRFVGEASERFDAVVLNELLDDLPCRVFYAGPDGEPHELAALAQDDGERWHVEVTSEPAGRDAPAPPPATVTTTSAESRRLVEGLAGLLEPGGMMIVHDYGFSERFANTAQYAPPQTGLPPFVDLDVPDAPGLPRSFFRIYGSEAAHAVQITNDVNFAELADVLELTGTVTTLPHGNALSALRTWPDFFVKGDGAFVSEFINLTADDDLEALLAELHERQAEHRARYESLLGEGKTGFMSDLLYVKSEA